MQVDFYIFRHGETDINKQKRWQGSGTDVDLNETGCAQAKCLIDKLKDKNLEVIISSTLIRAYHTAKIAAEGLGVEVLKHHDLRECHYGVAEAMTFDEVNARFREIAEAVFCPETDRLDVRFPGGESVGEVRQRVLAAISEIAKSGSHCIGLAIHGGTMSNLLTYLGVEKPKVPNCGCIHVVYDDGKLKLYGNVF